MGDIVLQNCTTVGGDSVDIEIQDGMIQRTVDAGTAQIGNFDKDDRYDVGGSLVTPTITEPHTHLFNSLIEGKPNTNDEGTLEQAWRTGDSNNAHRTSEDMKNCARRVLNWFIINGVTRVRTHLGTTSSEDGRFTSAETMLEIKEEYRGVVDIQIVAIPGKGVATDEETLEDFQTLLDMGVDVVGGIPHRENTRERGVQHIDVALDAAADRGLPVDFHIDETDDPHSRYTEVLATEAERKGIAERTTASHVTAMHSYPDAYADKLSRLLADTGVSVVTNPLTNSVLQGRYDDYPKRRGYTRFDELTDRGVTVGIGQDDIGDAANPYGDGDPLKTLFFFAHFAQKNRLGDEKLLWRMLLENNAQIYGADAGAHLLDEGTSGSVVVYDAPSAFEAIRTIPPRSLVIKNGDVLGRTDRESTLSFDDVGDIERSAGDL